MDALWFWFAKFLVDLGLFVGFIALVAVVGIGVICYIEWRVRTGRDAEGVYARRQLLERRPSAVPLEEYALVAQLRRCQPWTTDTRRSHQAALNRLVKQGYYERVGEMMRRTNKQEA